MILGPFDEVGHDQEIAGKAHAFDNPQLEFEAFFVFLDRCGMGDDRQPVVEALFGLTAQLFDLVIGEFRQDRIATIGAKGTAPGDFNRVFNRFRQVGKKRRHLLRRLEVMLTGQAAARLRLIHIGPFGHADHRVMGLVHLGGREINVVCGHQREVHPIGHVNEPTFGQPLGLGRAVFAGVTLQLDIKPVAKRPVQPAHQRLCRRLLSGLQQPSHRPVRPAAEADHTLGMGLQIRHGDMRQLPVPAQVERGVQLHQVLIATLVLRQQDQWRGRRGFLARGDVFCTEIHLTAHDRLNARAAGGHGKLQSGKHIVGVGHRDGGHARIKAETRQFLEPDRALQQRVFCMKAEMNESGLAAHAPHPRTAPIRSPELPCASRTSFSQWIINRGLKDLQPFPGNGPRFCVKG